MISVGHNVIRKKSSGDDRAKSDDFQTQPDRHLLVTLLAPSNVSY